MRNSNCTVLIVSPALIVAGRAVVADTGNPDVRLYLTGPMDENHDWKSLYELLELGKALPPVPALDWSPEQAGSQIAYLCATSGTSGSQVSLSTHISACEISYADLGIEIGASHSPRNYHQYPSNGLHR